MKLKKNTNLILVILLFCFLSQNTFSQEKKLLQNLSERSDIIVIGTVKNIGSQWNKDKTQIWTYVQIKSEESIKGNILQNEITVRVLGGEIGDIGMSVSGSPEFNINERYLCFLEKDSERTFAVSGWEAGKFVLKDGFWQNKATRISDSEMVEFKTSVKNK